MPASSPCPVLGIDRTLSPYINSRDETLKIRRTLSKYLASGLRPVNVATQNQHLNHECPHSCNVATANPPGLDNLRKSYLDAVRARAIAQKRHEELQVSMAKLQDNSMLESPREADAHYDGEVIQSYVALLRQRRRFAELQVVKESLEKLLDVSPVHGSEDPKDLIRRAIGEQPSLPPERLDKLAQPEDNGSLTLKVKKEVLEARSSMERANAARAEAEQVSPPTPTVQEQVYALSCARQEIVEWVQEELAKMEEDSGFLEDASPVKRTVGDAPVPHLASSESQVRDRYNVYNQSRSAAISSHESIQQRPVADSTGADDANVQHGVGAQEQEHGASTRMAMTKFLPYFSHLSRIDANERSLLQQAVYLHTQIASADEEAADALLRLSGESHLLPSGTKGIEAWGRTSADIEAVNGNFVRAKLQEGRQEVNNVATIVDLSSWQSKVLSSA